MASPRSYSTAYVAKRLGISIPTVQRWVDGGRLRAWKTPGGHRRIEADGADRLFAEQQALASRAHEPLRVVVVEDNPDDRDLMRVLLDELLPGCELRSFDNPIPALVAIGQEVPDVLISDVVMPHMDGLEMLRQLAGRCVVQPRRLLVLTSLSDTELARMGGLPEGVTLLRKPLDVGALALALRLEAAAQPR